MIGHVQVHRGIAMRVRTAMSILVVVMVELRVVPTIVAASMVRDRHDLPTPRASHELQQQHQACQRLGQGQSHRDHTVCPDPAPVKEHATHHGT